MLLVASLILLTKRIDLFKSSPPNSGFWFHEVSRKKNLRTTTYAMNTYDRSGIIKTQKLLLYHPQKSKKKERPAHAASLRLEDPQGEIE